MVILLFANAFMALLVLAISHNQATQNALEFYPSTLVTMIHAAVAGVAALAGLLVRKVSLGLLLASSILLTMMPLSCTASGVGYPGGDDGGSFGWLVYVGIASLVSMALGVATMVLGLVWDSRRQRREADAER